MTMARGRPVVALDVGGTSVKGALVGPSGALAGPPQRAPIDSAGSADAVLATMVRLIRTLAPARRTGDRRCGGGLPGSLRLRARRARPSRRREVRRPRRRGPARRAARAARARRICGSCSATTPRRRSSPRPCTAPASRSSACLGITLGAGMGACLVAGDAIVETSAGVVPGELYRQPFGAATADDAFSDRGLRARLGGADPAKAPTTSAVRAFAAFGADLGAFLAPWTEVLRADAVVVAGGIAAAFELFGPALENGAARTGARRRAGRGRRADRRRPGAQRRRASRGGAARRDRRLTSPRRRRDARVSSRRRPGRRPRASRRRSR